MSERRSYELDALMYVGDAASDGDSERTTAQVRAVAPLLQFGLVWLPPPLLLGPSEPIQRRHSSGHNSEVHKHPPAPLIEIVGVPRTGHLEYKKLL